MAQRTSKWIDVNGFPTFIEIDGSGPAMICCHGLGGNTNYFQPLVTAFASRFSVIRFDFKGLGRTGYNPGGDQRRITIPAYVEDLEAILRAKNITKAVLVGHSLGSVVCMHLAASIDRELVQALVLIGPGKSRAHIPAAKAMTLDMAKRAREIGMPAFADGAVAKNVAPTSSDVVRAFVRESVSAQSSEGYALVCEAACDESHIDPDYSKLSKYPTVIIAGNQDLISPLTLSEELHNDIRGSQLEVVNSGHQHVLEDTSGVVRAIEALLGRM